MRDLFGRLMIDINGKSLSEEDKFLISNKHIGGIILFTRNFESFEQLKNLINEIKVIKENIIIAVDQEGGRVQRFKNEFSLIPSMQEISIYAKRNNDTEIFKDLAWLISSELIAVGIDINFAPVLDVDYQTSSIIGNRSFSNNVAEVIEFSSKYISGMHEAGMKSTGKHFPGHGGISEDSHVKSPVDKRTLEELILCDIKPYTKLKDKLDIIMCGHILFPKVDSNISSSSKVWIKDFLKNKLNYGGLVVTDDLSMKGAGKQDCSIKTINSFLAGCDMAIICNNREEIKKVLCSLDEAKIKPIKNLSLMKKTKKVDWEKLKCNRRASSIKNKLRDIRSKHEKNSYRT